jgi:hypothetical protein
LPKTKESPRDLNQLAKGGHRALYTLNKKIKSFVIPTINLHQESVINDNETLAGNTNEKTPETGRTTTSKFARQSIATAPVESLLTKRSS